MPLFLYLNFRYRSKKLRRPPIYEDKVCTDLSLLRAGFSGQWISLFVGVKQSSAFFYPFTYHCSSHCFHSCYFSLL